MVTAKEWRKTETDEILQNLEVAARVLKKRVLTSEQKKYVLEIVKDLLEVIG